MHISLKDVVQAVLLLPSPCYLQQAAGFLSAFLSAMAPFVQEQLGRESVLTQAVDQVKKVPTKKSVPAIPKEFQLTRNETIIKDNADENRAIKYFGM